MIQAMPLTAPIAPHTHAHNGQEQLRHTHTSLLMSQECISFKQEVTVQTYAEVMLTAYWLHSEFTLETLEWSCLYTIQ